MSSNKSLSSTTEPRARVKQLANFDQVQLVDPRVPIRRYFRSGAEMLRMANMYHKEGQIESAFILYSKYITLFVERIPKHPEYYLISNEEKSDTKETLLMVFPIAEKLKAQLQENYAAQYAIYVEELEKDNTHRQEDEPKVSFVQDDSIPTSGHSSFSDIRVGSQCFESTDDYPYSSFESRSSGSIIYPNVDVSTPCVISSGRDSHPQSANYSQSPGLAVPVVDRSTKPRSLLSPGPDANSIYGLRTVIVPKDIMNGFLNFAKVKTETNIETCGILAGKMVHNELVITHVLIPPQTGSSDSCKTDSEEELFEFQDKFDLLTIGWIHTHPSQTAFLSSVDLHTQCSYQLTMPEAIAIVCSPKYRENKIFSLTEPGVDLITGCKQSGFHLHDVRFDLYMESPHVKLSSAHSATIINLSKRKQP